MSATLEQVIDMFNMKSHVEGGYSSCLHQDTDIIPVEGLPSNYDTPKHFSNSIYYLLPRGTRCVFHKIKMLEVWTFCLGGPITLYDLSPEGKLDIIVLGNQICENESITHVFPKNHWIGAIPCDESEYGLVTCFTSPAFTFEDWSIGDRESLMTQFPEHRDAIVMLT